MNFTNESVERTSSSRPPVDVFDVFDVVVPLARREENAADGRYLRTMSRTIANAFPAMFATGPDAAPLAARRTNRRSVGESRAAKS